MPLSPTAEEEGPESDDEEDEDDNDVRLPLGSNYTHRLMLYPHCLIGSSIH